MVVILRAGFPGPVPAGGVRHGLHDRVEAGQDLFRAHRLELFADPGQAENLAGLRKPSLGRLKRAAKKRDGFGLIRMSEIDQVIGCVYGSGLVAQIDVIDGLRRRPAPT